MRRFWVWLLVLFVAVWILTNPVSASDAVRGGFDSALVFLEGLTR